MRDDPENERRKTVDRLRKAAPGRPDPARLEAIVAGVMEKVARRESERRASRHHWRAWGAGLATAAALAVVLLPGGGEPARTGPLGPDEMSVLLEHVQGFEDMETIRDLAQVLDDGKAAP